MVWGSWALRAVTLLAVFSGVSFVALFDNNFALQAGNTLFPFLQNETARTFAFYGILFFVGTAFAFLAERSIKKDALEQL